MPRLVGVDIPGKKRIDIALRYIYGIGPAKATQIVAEAKIDPAKKADDLTPDELRILIGIIQSGHRVEGDLRRQIQDNIKRLIEIRSYRGIRHSKSLPARGQRTRSNARTKRGKRVTIGAMKKDDRIKTEVTAKPEEKK